MWTGGQVVKLTLPSLSDVDAESNNNLRQVKVVHQVGWTLYYTAMYGTTLKYTLYYTSIYFTTL